MPGLSGIWEVLLRCFPMKLRLLPRSCRIVGKARSNNHHPMTWSRVSVLRGAYMPTGWFSNLPTHRPLTAGSTTLRALERTRMSNEAVFLFICRTRTSKGRCISDCTPSVLPNDVGYASLGSFNIDSVAVRCLSLYMIRDVQGLTDPLVGTPSARALADGKDSSELPL